MMAASGIDGQSSNHPLLLWDLHRDRRKAYEVDILFSAACILFIDEKTFVDVGLQDFWKGRLGQDNWLCAVKALPPGVVNFQFLPAILNGQSAIDTTLFQAS